MIRFAALVVYAFAAADPPGYPNDRQLLEPAVLAKAPADYHVLDVRSKDDFEKRHVAGAVRVDPAGWSKAILGGTADAAFWSRELAAVGVTPRKPVAVIGDDARDYCRVWWMLKLAGVADARVVNGGYKGYAGPTAAGAAPPAPAAPHAWVPERARLATKADLLAELARPTGGVADARSTGEHTGADPLKNKRAGCVPGAAHLEWSELLDPATGRFLAPDRMGKLMADRKIDLGRPQVTYCQGGGRAAVLAFGLELMGAKGVRNYYASWGEWGNDPDTPVQTPDKK